jgi:hypothetical protein
MSRKFEDISIWIAIIGYLVPGAGDQVDKKNIQRGMTFLIFGY